MFSGNVIDGYIEGANVCLDLNANQACDTGEPSDTSKAKGAFSLDISGVTAAQLATAHLLTTVPNTAKDADDAGKTLAEAGKLGFSLMAPAIAFASADGKTLSAIVISPLTTLVSHDMIAGNNKPLAAAQAAVVQRMDLIAGTNLNQDFVANNNVDLGKKAQVIAAALASVGNTVKTSAPGTTDRDAFLAALTYLQQNVAALAQSVQSVPANTTLSTTQLVNTALATASLVPNTITLVAVAQQISTASPVDVATILAGGFYDLSWGCSSSASTTPITTPITTTGSSATSPAIPTNCSISGYHKTSGSNGVWLGSEYLLSTSNVWTLPLRSTSNRQYLASTGWVTSTSSNTGTYTADGQGGGTGTNTDKNQSFRFTFRAVDISGKTAASIGTGYPATVVPGTMTFPAGSQMLWGQSSPFEDSYELQTSFPVNAQVCAAGAVCGFTNLPDFIGAFSTANASTNRYQQWNNQVFTFDAGGTSSGGSVSLWGPQSGVCTSTSQCRSKIGSAPYEIRTVRGQQLLVIKAPSSDGSYTIFAVSQGKLFGGRFSPAGVFDANQDPDFNKVAINAILAATGKPAVDN
jgi:hypothetical protein